MTSASITSDQFRQAMAHFATGVAVVTAQDDHGDQGATISALSSVSLDPLTLLICLKRGSATCRAIEHTRRFGLSVLSREQEPIARYFAMPADRKQGTVATRREADGTVLVEGALVHIAAEVVETLRGGTHEIFLARPLRVTVDSDPAAGPLLYFRGAFDLPAHTERHAGTGMS